MLPSGRSALFSDTVGFLTDLPPQLIAAFKSTLEEVNHADLLLHVVDASSPYRAEQRRTVLHILREIGVPEQRLRSRLIEVHNKADSLPPEASAEGAEKAEEEEEEEGKPARFGPRLGPRGGGPGGRPDAFRQGRHPRPVRGARPLRVRAPRPHLGAEEGGVSE